MCEVLEQHDNLQSTITCKQNEGADGECLETHLKSFVGKQNFSLSAE